MALSLRIENVDAGYGAVRALHGVSIAVGNAETVALLGALRGREAFVPGGRLAATNGGSGGGPGGGGGTSGSMPRAELRFAIAEGSQAARMSGNSRIRRRNGTLLRGR